MRKQQKPSRKLKAVLIKIHGLPVLPRVSKVSKIRSLGFELSLSLCAYTFAGLKNATATLVHKNHLVWRPIISSEETLMRLHLISTELPLRVQRVIVSLSVCLVGSTLAHPPPRPPPFTQNQTVPQISEIPILHPSRSPLSYWPPPKLLLRQIESDSHQDAPWPEAAHLRPHLRPFLRGSTAGILSAPQWRDVSGFF